MKRIIIVSTCLILLSACTDKLSANAVHSNGGQCPSDHPIKGNRNDSGEWIYHVKGGQYYNKTNAEECFANVADATVAGYRRSKH